MAKTITQSLTKYVFDPDKYALSGTEDAHQISLFGWCAMPETREKYPELRWLFAIPNGGFRTKSGAGKLRAMGVRRGVPDICLPVRRGAFPALFIELKRPPITGKRAGKSSAEQDQWINFLREQGFGAMICVGWQEARAALISYLDYKP